MTPDVSVIIATRDRAAFLPVMLRSLDVALDAAGCATEVIVVDNGSTDGTPAILDRWIAAGPARVRLVAEAPGKTRALNIALRRAQAPVLAFTDDDVEVTPHWIRAVAAFFATQPAYAAAVGCIRIPPAITDPALLAQIAYYRTLPFFEAGDHVHDETHLYGCNMAVRRSAFDCVGTYDERLGVGASGAHEERDLARRMARAGLRIGYMPDAVVYHSVEASRLTEACFRNMHLRDARSRFVMDPHRGWFSSIAHWLGAVAVLGRWSLTRNAERQMRARGRLLSHTEFLRLRWQQHQGRGK